MTCDVSIFDIVKFANKEHVHIIGAGAASTKKNGPRVSERLS